MLSINYSQIRMLDERADPENDCTIHVWLGRDMKRQSNTLTDGKRGQTNS